METTPCGACLGWVQARPPLVPTKARVLRCRSATLFASLVFVPLEFRRRDFIVWFPHFWPVPCDPLSRLSFVFPHFFSLNSVWLFPRPPNTHAILAPHPGGFVFYPRWVFLPHTPARRGISSSRISPSLLPIFLARSFYSSNEVPHEIMTPLVTCQVLESLPGHLTVRIPSRLLRPFQ